ncbi:MAG TPA: serine/threonine-protein kinase [Dictyobacter sp.]|jgi:serine/threonine protein kinase|nr:serine/threonine-protein kinase [Dictyobacter sp.]
MQELVDITIGRYHIERGLARGGMSEVYLAHDEQTDSIVAMKMVRRSAGEYYERFLRETRVIKNLKHDHILPALEAGVYQQWAYLATPYMEGGTLTQHIAKGPLSLEEAGELLNQLASALQFAHDHGVLHRDIKSSNVLLRDDHYAYLTDFGLVKTMDDKYSLTRSGFLIGTPEYMAPELVDANATPLSDIYALGVLLYQMVTGVVPFRAANPVAVVMKHLRDVPPPPSSINPAISPDVERVILQTLEKDPQRRFRTARALANAYHQAVDVNAVPDIPANLIPEPVVVHVVPRAATIISSPRIRRSFPFVDKRTGMVIAGVAIILLIVIGCILSSTLGKASSLHHPSADHGLTTTVARMDATLAMSETSLVITEHKTQVSVEIEL